MQRKFDLLIFDLDGTLIDNSAGILMCFNLTLEKYGFKPVVLKRITPMFGSPIKDIFKNVLPEQNEERLERMRETYKGYFDAEAEKGLVFLYGVPKVLVNLRKKGFKLAVATTKEDRTASLLLKKVGLDKYFDAVTGTGGRVRPKPHPDTISKTMDLLKATASRTAMIGDTPLDIDSAKNAGVYAIAILSGVRLGYTTVETLKKTRPDVIIEDLTELEEQVSA